MSKLKRAKKLIGKNIELKHGEKCYVVNVSICPPKSDLFMRQEKWFLGIKVRRINGEEHIFKLTSRLNCRIG